MQATILSYDKLAHESWRTKRESFKASSDEELEGQLKSIAQGFRRQILEMISNAGQGHIGGDYSVIDVLTALYFKVLEIDPEHPESNDRDRFILSKGHCAGAFYTVLANAGFFNPEELMSFMAPYSALNGHPNRNKVPGVETNTGPLGHGLPVAVGTAVAAKLQKRNHRTFVITGDGELQEGSNWEAMMAASQFGLDNLTLIVDRNRLQQGAGTEETNSLEPLDQKLAAFGFEVRIIDGHNFGQILEALLPSKTGKPVGVISNTIKGKGVSFMENLAAWHHKVPSPEQVVLALEELQ
jgi:transketolase